VKRKHRDAAFARAWFSILVCAALALLSAEFSNAQGNSHERTFPQSKPMVEKALRGIEASMAGHLPVLDGFAVPGDRAFDRYQRAYYQSTVQVIPTRAGGSLVRVSTKVTAWYADPSASRSGYQLLTSNGRLEADLLDQLADVLASGVSAAASNSPASAAPSPIRQDAAEPTISAPMPRIPDTGSSILSAIGQRPTGQGRADSQPGPGKAAEAGPLDLQAEAQNLQEILKNQAHPNNLVAVKKSGTPVVATPSLNAKTLFLASAHDEFEMLDFNADWVHVRISGLSRGWIWRSSLEMPGSVPDVDMQTSGPPVPTAADLFHVSREETAPFPGDWAPLRGKSVKIISVQKMDDGAKDAAPEVKLEFAKSLLDKSYAELAKAPRALAGVVLIFDSVEGGMIAATLASLEQWKAGALSDAALWHQCFFDPPETFDSSSSSTSSASQ
jgi:hypothetical protein